MENVPSVPDVRIDGYGVQRVPLSDHECGGVQIRMRHFQFGHRDGWVIRPDRAVEGVIRRRKPGPVPVATTTKASSKWESFANHCRKQGYEPSEISLPGWSREARFRAVGNGVSRPVGRVVAAAVGVQGPPETDDCPCGCGRRLVGRQKSATVTCRKRRQLRRDSPADVIEFKV